MALDLKNLLGQQALTYLLQKLKNKFTTMQADIDSKSTFSGNYNDLTNKPSSMKNPQALTFTGAQTGTYDGSAALEIEIPTPEGLTAATQTNLGGVKAAAKGEIDTVRAKIGDDNMLFVGIYPTELPASDVYEWAKQENKPSYTPTEVGVIGTAPASGQVAVFDGTTGKIKSTGFTIEKSVPDDAKFTDTTYETGNATTAGIGKLYTVTGNNADGSMTQGAITNALSGKLSTTGTAAKATADAEGQNIADTYIKSVTAEGRTVTVTKGDGSTTTFQTQDTDTKYSNATDSSSGLMSATDKQKLDEFGDASAYALKSDLSTVYKYKGTVANDSSLPDDAETGDVYNITSSDLYGDGANVAWTGTAWDNLAGVVDLTGYVETADMEEMGNTEIDEIWNTVFGS